MKTKQSEVSEKANARQGGRYAATKTKQSEVCELSPSGEMPAYTISEKANARQGGRYAATKKLPVLSLSKWLALFLFILMPFALMSGSYAGENEIRQLLKSRFPNLGEIDHVAKTDYLGLYEITTDGQMYYVDENAQYLFDGHIIELSTKRDVTEERKRILFAIDFNKLPLDLAVIRVKGNGKRKLAVFTDPKCSFCQRLEKEFDKVSDVTLYLFMYPIFPGSDEIVRNVRCAKDPLKAWDNWMLRGISPKSAKCKTPTDRIMALGQKLRVNGTPNLIFANGMQFPGYLPAAELEKNLNAPDIK